MKKSRLRKEDRKPFALEDLYFLDSTKGNIQWASRSHYNSDYSMACRNGFGLSREALARKMGRHPTQIGRYENSGFDRQFPRFDAFRKLIVLLGMNPIKALNLRLVFRRKKIYKKGTGNLKLENSDFDLVRQVLNWAIECSDDRTAESLKKISSEISSYLGE